MGKQELEEEVRLLTRIVEDLDGFKLNKNGRLRTVYRWQRGWKFMGSGPVMTLLDAIRAVEAAEREDEPNAN